MSRFMNRTIVASAVAVAIALIFSSGALAANLIINRVAQSCAGCDKNQVFIQVWSPQGTPVYSGQPCYGLVTYAAAPCGSMSLPVGARVRVYDYVQDGAAWLFMGTSGVPRSLECEVMSVNASAHLMPSAWRQGEQSASSAVKGCEFRMHGEDVTITM
ncbi:MAG: hypothetical protein WCH32_15520 [Pseudomonadota bacterium]